MNEKITLFVDGGCSGNGQLDLSKRKMVSVVTDNQGVVLLEKNNTGGSNNIAELIAILEALRWCFCLGVKDVLIKTDSRNNLSWVWGRKVGKKINDRDLVLKIKEDINLLLTKIKLELLWVPREENLAGHYIESKYKL